jgi:hypothetical protein
MTLSLRLPNYMQNFKCEIKQLQNKNEEKVFPLYSFCYQTMPVAYWAGWG